MGTLSSVVVALATAVIAWATWQVHKTTKMASAREETFREQLSDLYQALVIATIVGAVPTGSTLSVAIGRFRNQYKGKTPIFEEGP